MPPWSHRARLPWSTPPVRPTPSALRFEGAVGQTIVFCRLSISRGRARNDRPPKAMVCPTGFPLCVLAQPVAEGLAIENDSLARILQVSLAPELIHVMGDDLPRGAHILGEQ